MKFSVYWGLVLGSSLTRAGIASENHVGPWEGLCLASPQMKYTTGSCHVALEKSPDVFLLLSLF